VQLPTDKPYTLIATLGRSPGAVTGLYRALFDEMRGEIPISRLVVLHTDHPDVKQALNIVRENLKLHPQPPEIVTSSLSEADYVETQVSAFQKIVTDAIQQQQADGRQVVVGIAGGRTSMGAMLAVSAQLFPEVVTHVYHLWVDSQIEKYGDIERLMLVKRRDAQLYLDVLQPPPDRRQLIRLPNLSQTNEHLRAQRELVSNTPSRELAGRADVAELDEILSLLPRRMRVEEALQFLDVLNALQRGEPLHDDALLDVLKNAGVTDADKYLKSLKAYALRDEDADVLIQKWIADIESDRPYWARGLKETYLKYREDISVGLSATQTVAAVVQIGLSLFGIQFKV